MDRPSWDSYFMDIARVVASRSTCLRRQVGAVMVKERRLLTTGYNGSPRGLKHCRELGCLREELQVPPGERHELCRGLHAEQNAIIQGAIYGVSIRGATLYCTHFPCSLCAKMLINSGICHLVVSSDYPDPLSKQLLEEAKVLITHCD